MERRRKQGARMMWWKMSRCGVFASGPLRAAAKSLKKTKLTQE